MDSTGVPHILEHNVLCGSQKFPCRDPFFKMLNRSLSTFMNAMTGSDYTIYPFSTQNATDFTNLMSVYLDAVFKPNLKELDFLQEGWRLEHEDPTDKNSPIVFKGVVFNEMKGVFADSQRLFMQKLQNGILPSHTYGYISGGDPYQIPNLTWENLKKFHGDHYHPSNCRIFTYGNIPLQNHLDYINREYLSKYEKIQLDTTVPSETRWSNERKAHIGCSVDPMISLENQTTMAVSYLLADINDNYENFVLGILGALLTSGPSAPFYKSLIESGLGTSFSPVAGFDDSTRSTTFTIGLQGMNNAKTKEVYAAIEATFDDVIREGFSRERIESVLHNIELGIKHQTSSFGLHLIMNLTPLWNHDGDVVGALHINEKLDKFRKDVQENPKFLQDKVKDYFKNNKHKFTLTMAPEENYEQKLMETEENLLQEKLEKLSEKDKGTIWNLGQKLKLKQELKEDISCLPTLSVSDISRIAPSTLLTHLKIGEIPLQLCIQPTNGVTYFNAILNTKDLPRELISLVPLFCSILPNMGAGEMDFRTFTQRSELVSGGLCSSFHLIDHPSDHSSYEEGIYISSYCLEKNFVSMLDLWSKLMNELRLDDISRFTTLVKMIATEKANTLVYNGHAYAMTFASSSTNYVSQMKEQLEGITYLQYLKELSDNCNLEEILVKMKLIAEHLLNKNRMRIAINSSHHCDEDIHHIEKFLKGIGGIPMKDDVLTSIPSTYSPCAQQTHHVFPFPVNFSAKAFTCIPYAHPDSGSLRVLARLMFHFLHREIREKGGAYGGGAAAHPGGPFCFFSYRDPHSTRTLKTFDDAIDWVLSKQFTQQDIDEAKLGVFQKVDAPIAPGSKGLRQFLSHVSDDMFDTHRRSILDTQKEDLVSVCKKYLKDNKFLGTCLIGPHNEDIQKNSSWNIVSH